MKVIFINNYPMNYIWEQWKQGKCPAHHLWGVSHLSQHGIEVEILPYEKFKIFNKIGKMIGAGHSGAGLYLDQQLRVMSKLSSFDLVYSACQYNTWFLANLRRLNIFERPIVSLIHHPLTASLKPSWGQLFLDGHDHLLCQIRK
jgi:hypothetical protein